MMFAMRSSYSNKITRCYKKVLQLRASGYESLPQNETLKPQNQNQKPKHSKLNKKTHDGPDERKLQSQFSSD